jgi:ferredoxin-nitrate reductase
MHWGKILNSDLNRANNLTANLVDPVSGEPDFKFTAVQAKRYIKPKQKIIVIGAGAGAFGFVKTYRGLNADDEIHVFSNEALPFYNRVLLPDYVTGHLKWDSLVKMTDDEERCFNIHFHRGTA